MKEKLKVFGHLLGFLWCLPVSILVWIFMTVQIMLGKVEEITLCPNFSIIWDVSNDSWMYSMLKGRGWYGCTLGNNIIVSDAGEEYSIKIKHEGKHVIHNYICGVFFLPVYIIVMLYIFSLMQSKHSYLDHPFERSARKAAGQKLDYTREEWPNGPTDRWSWW